MPVVSMLFILVPLFWCQSSFLWDKQNLQCYTFTSLHILHACSMTSCIFLIFHFILWKNPLHSCVNKFNTLRSLPLKLNTLCSHFTSDIDAKGFINYLCLLWISQMLLVSCYWRIFSVLNCCFEPTFIAFTQRCLDIVQSLHKPACVQRVSWTETAFRLLCSKTLTSFLYSNN